VLGGARFIEMTSPNGHDMVPHMHIIVDLNQDLMGKGGISLLEFESLFIEEWCNSLGIMTSNKWLHIEQIDTSDEESVKRILRYPFKAPAIHDDPVLVSNFLYQMAHIHRVSYFGNWRKHRLPLTHKAQRSKSVYYYKNATQREPAPAIPGGPPEDDPAPPPPKWAQGWQELDQKLRE
jgi:hypothetical protein